MFCYIEERQICYLSEHLYSGNAPSSGTVQRCSIRTCTTGMKGCCLLNKPYHIGDYPKNTQEIECERVCVGNNIFTDDAYNKGIKSAYCLYFKVGLNFRI